MREPILVALGHYPDIFTGFQMNVDAIEPGIPKILIRDGVLIEKPEGWSMIDGDLPFVYARNVNLGWRVTGNADVILCGDDIRFDSLFVDALQRAAYSDPKVGVSTVQLHGQSPFVCGYFKREVLDAVGPMDERFDAYGEDDRDWWTRMERLGYHTLPTSEVQARHGGGSTFYRKQRERGGETVQEGNDRMKKLFREKWGVE